MSESTEGSQQLLQITPRNALLFKGPFDTPSKTYIKILNVSTKKVLFKVKTTMSKCYSVQPNRGVLEPSSKNNIMVCLKAFTYDPENKNRHKFMVQSTTAPIDIEENSLKEAWKKIPQDKIVEYKLKCVFDATENSKEEWQCLDLQLQNTFDWWFRFTFFVTLLFYCLHWYNISLEGGIFNLFPCTTQAV